MPTTRSPLGQDDGVRPDVLAHLPGEEHGADLLLRRCPLRHHLQHFRCHIDVAIGLDQDAALDLLHLRLWGSVDGDRSIGAQQSDVLLLPQVLQRLRFIPRCDDAVDEV